tara:strand:- start:265 stop:483 length:219 start_codon:yes stop_codon:yes gene_type:complete
MKTIKPNTTIEARSAFDHECIFKITVISRTPKMATIKDPFGETRRAKIHTDHNGDEYISGGSYSFAPIYRAA